jgi:hypothetical protein
MPLMNSSKFLMAQFLLNGQIVPIEVKSGLNAKAQSLKVYRQRYNPALSVRFSLLPLETNNGLLNIPLYYSFIFKQLTDKTKF